MSPREVVDQVSLCQPSVRKTNLKKARIKFLESMRRMGWQGIEMAEGSALCWWLLSNWSGGDSRLLREEKHILSALEVQQAVGNGSLRI